MWKVIKKWEGVMEGRARVLCLGPDGPKLAAWASRLFLVASLLGFTFLSAPRAHAQAQPHLAISELNWELQGTDRTRECWEVANLGTAAWNPNDYWLLRIAAADGGTQQGFVRIQGVDSIPPGGVLFIEWGRPTTDLSPNILGTTKGNVFVTGRTFADGAAFDGSDLLPEMALAVYAPTTNNVTPTVADDTMVAYYFQGDPFTIDRDLYAYDKATAAGLWRLGDSAGNLNDPQHPRAFDWARALRMGPGTYPINYGRSADDYYYTAAGVPSIDNAGFDLTSPPADAPDTMNRAGTPALPNYLWGVPPLPGQITAGLFAVSAQAVPATLAANSPATGVVVAALSKDGVVGTTVFANNQWSPFLVFSGPPIDGMTLIDNPKRQTRTLLVKAVGTGELGGAIGGADPGSAFGGLTDLNMAVNFAPVAAVDPATGDEYYVIVDTKGAIGFSKAVNGTPGAFTAITGVTTDAPVAAVWNPDIGSLVVVAWNGNQLVLNSTDDTGKFGTWLNVGPAVTARPAGMAPVVAWNQGVKQVEIVMVSGDATAADLGHARAQMTRTATTINSTVTTIASLPTSVAPAIAVNSDNGQVRLLARPGTKEPGLDPRTGSDDHSLTADPPDTPQSGFVLASTFDGTAWSALARVATGRLPGPSPATPIFKTAVAPVTLYDANTKRFNDILIGEDAQIYSVPLAP
jgi:hypothetical protein